ncbi:MAG: hypothetical protein WCD70_12335, partial [Alphaproteobacteria bacterium]
MTDSALNPARNHRFSGSKKPPNKFAAAACFILDPRLANDTEIMRLRFPKINEKRHPCKNIFSSAPYYANMHQAKTALRRGRFCDEVLMLV